MQLRAADAPPWVDAAKAVHSRFSGRKGSFAQFGDSITITKAYWSPLQWQRKNMDGDTQKAFDNVKAYMQKDCWDWKGDKFGNDGGKTIAWADEHIDQWLKDLNPETALIMFGTNDLNQVPIDQYEAKLRDVIQKCQKNGTIVILSTIPPKHGMLEKAKQYAGVDRKIAREMKLPLIDFFDEILKRRPTDWDGADPKLKQAGKEYDSDTLLGGDGVHPSYPTKYQGDYSEEGLKHCGYGLRTYLTLRMYDRVIESVLK
ncbi:MAG TPA: SGNH/GDSL hydrolase family protein [Tepidisphaeraceae bacterium]|jgi:hypothetical protein|nr:SGNH/GDSL hydrolase family protein [Tepidisphaeraceae bacterium]